MEQEAALPDEQGQGVLHEGPGPGMVPTARHVAGVEGTARPGEVCRHRVRGHP